MYSRDTGKVSAIIVAAGSSTRMGLSVNKQLIYLNQVPLIAHAVNAFEKSELIKEIVLVVAEKYLSEFEKIAQSYEFKKISKIIPGGDSRQKSVEIGVMSSCPEFDYIAVHDGARPLVSVGIIDRTITDAFEYKAATAAVKVKDTIKVSDEAGFVEETPDRNKLWSIQTPQVFEKSLYIEALELAKEAGMNYTDDCQMIERLNKKVYLSMGEYSNIKVTTPEDILMAESILLTRENNNLN